MICGTCNTKKEAQKELDKMYNSFVEETNRKKSNYNGYNYERLRKNTWKVVDEYDKWHNGTYSILNFSIVTDYDEDYDE